MLALNKETMSQMRLKITSDLMGISQLGARPGGKDLQHLTCEAPKLASFIHIFSYCHHANPTSIFN